MIGTWKGKYKYSVRQSSELYDKEIEFLLKITEFDGENFIGTVQDNDHNYGTRGIGTIKGKINDKNIEFIKQMPIKTTVSMNGKRIENEYEKHKPIYYTGISNLKNSYSGHWKFKGADFINRLFHLLFAVKGTWEITKIE
ncbi:hypothetical protein [Chryseobacterium viscerum]|uniref:DUF1579 domain-containing protein n=1 Tax=Chryseobacterium viscerum TaxID=1037377 RepID=A0A316WGJ6_9FLAO|nr:hypothetical protein [Chryseobacterium viscerum]PWN60259.1 hypothetical protein C1634_014930 [Chryseobacterium viscerum]